MRIRVKFAKYGVMKFIGHLDILRYFQKAVKRSGIDAVYTAGFNPHMVMSFAAPLGVGIESTGEYMDIEVRDGDALDIKNALNASMVDGIDIIGAVLLPDDAGNVMASVAAARYAVKIIWESGDTIDRKSQFKSFIERESIIIQKKTKKSIIEEDLKPRIYDVSFTDEEVILLLDASSSGNIKPSVIIETFLNELGLCTENIRVLIRRIETYGFKNGEFASLISSTY